MRKLFNPLQLAHSVSSTEKMVSALGGAFGIFLIAWVSFKVTGMQGAALIVPSMGASAVLLFAVPHGKLSQPWALFGGHLLSAIIGVACFQLIPDTFLAAGLAVGIAIGAMHVANCIHPPGGATALAAVIGGPAIHQLGFNFILSPILLNTTIIFICAVVFNHFFPWRRYPASRMRYKKETPEENNKLVFTNEHIEQAIEEMDLVVDVTTDDLLDIFQLASRKAGQSSLGAAQIKLGHVYTNDRQDNSWAVRQIIDEHRSDDPERDMVIYRIIEGHGIRRASSCTRQQFADWAKRELESKKT